MDRLNKSLIASMLFLCSYYGFSQQYPVQVTTTLVPPYSLYLSDYTAIGSNNLQVLVNLLELDRPNLQIKFRITIEGAGITLRTSPTFMPRPLNIQGGVPELFTGADLTSYFNPDHMDFSGITRAAFKRSGQLPEGFYTFTLEVLEYNRNVRVSNHSVSYAWIVLNDPPLLNTPFNGDKLIATDPQNIMFSWTPRHTASPNAAFSTEYEFRLVELYPGQTNPDIAIRSSNSIYTTTTTLTSLNYGIIEPTLIPGKKYAFRVRAYDTSGRDLFKNDGYSETYVFQYGDACGTFEGIAAKTLDPQRARISWEPEQHHTGCVINYRKNGKEDWFTQEVNGSYGIVAQLAGRTTYEYQLIPQCGTILGEKSPVMTFTTPEVDESGFVCGAPIPEFDGSDVPLMKPLLPLDVIQVGDWTVNLLNVTANGDGTYGGAGYAAVPNFNLANVRVVFDRILVNEDYQVVAGDIKTVYSEDSRFVLDIQKKEEEPEVVEGPEGTDTELTEDLVADVLNINIEADIGEVIFSGGQLEVYDESGNLIEDTDLDLPPEGEELTITDSNGDTWVVDSEGVVKEGHVGEASTPESSEVDVIVQFKPTEESSYGFDAYDPDIPQLRHFYQNILTINDEEYVPAWKSVPVGMPDQVIAMAGENEFPENMKFRSSTVDLEPMAGQQDNAKHLSVIGKAHGDIDVIEAYQSIEDEEQVAGRIHVISYEKIYKTLEIVPVNGASIGDIHTIGDRINNIFQQAAVEWKVEAAEPFMVDPKLLENFDEGESGMLASFPDKMQKFNREFKRSRPVDKETYYIFIIDEGSASLSGFMPFKRQFGYVFTKNTSYTNKTIAHELAHGAFRLRHTFSSAYGIPQRSTDNLMDYSENEDRLKKFQWDLIHDPENLVGWFEDDEESALEGISGWWEGNSILKVPETKVVRNELLLTYQIRNWTSIINKLKLDNDRKGEYQIVFFVQHNQNIVYSQVSDIKNYSTVTWDGLVFEDLIQMSKENYTEFKFHLGILPKDAIGLDLFKNWRFSQGGRPESTVLQHVETNVSTTFIDLVPDIPLEINNYWFDWVDLSDEARSITTFDHYQKVIDILPKADDNIGEIFKNKADPIQFLYDNSVITTFLGVKIRVHWKFAEKLKLVEKRLTDDDIKLGRYRQGEIGGIGVRPQYSSPSVSIHSYGMVVDIKPNYNHYISKYRKELLFFIEQVTGLNLFDENRTASQITQASNLFNGFSTGLNSYDDLVGAYERIEKYRNQTEHTYDLATLNTINHVTDFNALSARIEIGLVNLDEFKLYYSKLKLLNTLVNGTSSTSDLNYVIFDDQSRQALRAFAQEVETLTKSLAPLENSLTDDQLSSLFNSVTSPVEVDMSLFNTRLSEFISKIKKHGFASENESRPLYAFAELLKTQSAERDFIKNIFSNGFCELPLELIQSFEMEEDVQWGGRWEGTNVDYMHFEIEKYSIAKYLKQEKP